VADRQTQAGSAGGQLTHLYCLQLLHSRQSRRSVCRAAASDAVAVLQSSYAVHGLPAQRPVLRFTLWFNYCHNLDARTGPADAISQKGKPCDAVDVAERSLR